jgi:uncharacterized protein YjbI with pentapeptide repeats
MPDPEHVGILGQGVEMWNQWRSDHPEIKPDLTSANLIEANLFKANLRLADLAEAQLTGANLLWADLSGARIAHANLSQADLSQTKMIRCRLNRACLREAYMFRANLREADLSEADLNMANLLQSDLRKANLSRARLSRADLSEANLSEADLFFADLSMADLTEAKLIGTNFHGSNLSEAVFDRSVAAFVLFAHVDLSTSKGLDSMIHLWPSSIGIDTIYRSEGNISDIFLRRAGIPENFITTMRTLVRRSPEYALAFIRSALEDQSFANQLLEDLQKAGIRCWLAPMGAKSTTIIDHFIRLRGKLIVVISKHSIDSRWVENEIQLALDAERKSQKRILFPICSDSSAAPKNASLISQIGKTYQTFDFTNWQDPGFYQKAVEQLLEELKSVQ